ncbi:MAG: PAS domain S-box protein [Minisyncoccia bacterium]
MENQTNTTDTKKGSAVGKQHTGRNTLIIVGVILITIGVLGSFFSAQAIEKFFWEARTKSEIKTVAQLYKSIGEHDIAEWKDADANERIGVFAQSIRQYLPSIAAMKIFTVDGTIAWTDLRNVKPGYKKIGIEKEINEVESAGQMIKPASESTKQELIKENLLEIWTTLKNPQGRTLGYVELYFDSTDITAFINRIQYAIWGTTTIVLGVIITLIGVVFKKQDELIFAKANELADIVEKAPIGIYTVDKKGVVSSMNPKMGALIDEISSEKILGKNIFDTENTKKMNIEGDIREAIIGASFNKEVSAIDKNGNEVHRQYSGTPLFETDGKTVAQVLFMVVDISERKKLEKELALHTKDLENRVVDRTKELQTKIEELEQFERLTVGREIRMTELKQQVEKMRIKLESMGVDYNSL